MKRSLPAALAALILLSPAAALWAGKVESTPAEAKEMVARFISVKITTYLDKKAAILNVTPALGGSAMKMVMADKNMIDFVVKFQPGDYVRLTYAKLGHDLMVGNIEAYDLKPGEDVPGVFIYSKSGARTVDKKEVTTVTVTKFGAEVILTVPTAKNSQGKMAPKEELMKVIEGFKSGDMVEVKAAGNMLQSIKVYDAPLLGEFRKTEKAADSGLTTVEVKIGPDVQTLSIAKKDATLAAGARKLKSGDLVYFRTTTDDKGTWLAELKPAPPGTKPPSAKSKDDMKPPKTTEDK
jgi:hypothetical protein